MRQRRANEERLREKHIDEVNERQLGKVYSKSIDIDVTSMYIFRWYETIFFYPKQ